MAGAMGGLAAMSACMPQPDQQATIHVFGINGSSGDEDLAVTVERQKEQAGNPIDFEEVDGDLSVAETVVEITRDDITRVTLSVLPDREGALAFAAPISTDDLVFVGTDSRHIAVSTEDEVYGDVDVACDVFRAEDMAEEGKPLKLGNTFPLPVARVVEDADGELAAGGFNFDHVAIFNLGGTAGGHAVFECEVGRESDRTRVEADGGNDDEGDDDSSDGGDDDDSSP